jgi:hypothetical protein
VNFDDFKTVRRWNAINRFLQIVLGITLVCALNYLAARSSFHARWNIAPDAARALSLESVKQLEAIARRAPQDTAPAKPWVTVHLTLAEGDTGDASDAGGSPELPALARLLRELLDDTRYAASKIKPEGWLRVERTNQRFNAGLYNKFREQYGIGARTALVVTCRDRVRTVEAGELYDASLAATGGADGAARSFRGEGALLGALLAATTSRPARIYRTVGHREHSDEELASLDLRLRSRNIALLPLNLGAAAEGLPPPVNEVPLDADAVLLAGPRSPFSPAETEKLRRYLRGRNGRVLVCLDPGTNARLEDLFYDWGVLSDDALLYDPASTAGGVTVSPLANREHELTRKLHSHLVFAKARPVRPDPAAPADETLSVTWLLASSPERGVAWAERDYVLEPFRFNPERGDMEPPVSIAAAAERAAGLRMKLSVTGGRLLVVGTSDILTRKFLGMQGNEFFVLNALNWLLAERSQLVGVPPRPLADFYLRTSRPPREEITALAWRFALFPAGALVLGLLVSLWRRNT